MKMLSFISLLILSSIDAVIGKVPQYTPVTKKHPTLSIQHSSNTMTIDETIDKIPYKRIHKTSDTNLLEDSHYEKLADCIYKTLFRSGLLSEKAEKLKDAVIIKKIQANLRSLARKTRLNIEIIDTTIENFIIALNDYLFEKEKFATKKLSVKQSAPIIKCIQEIKNSISQNIQLQVVENVLATEEAEKARSILQHSASQLQSIADGTKKATTEAVAQIFDDTKKNLETERKKVTEELTKVKNSFAQRLIQSVSDALSRMFGVTSETTDEDISSTQKHKSLRQ